MMTTIRNLKMIMKLFLLVFVAMFFMVAVGLVGFIYMDKMAQNSEAIYEHNFIPLTLFATLDSNVKETRAYIFEILLTEDPSRIRQLQANIMTNSEGTLHALEELQNVKNKTPEGLALYNEILSVSDPFQKH